MFNGDLFRTVVRKDGNNEAGKDGIKLFYV